MITWSSSFLFEIIHSNKRQLLLLLLLYNHYFSFLLLYHFFCSFSFFKSQYYIISTNNRSDRHASLYLSRKDCCCFGFIIFNLIPSYNTHMCVFFSCLRVCMYVCVHVTNVNKSASFFYIKKSNRRMQNVNLIWKIILHIFKLKRKKKVNEKKNKINKNKIQMFEPVYSISIPCSVSKRFLQFNLPLLLLYILLPLFISASFLFFSSEMWIPFWRISFDLVPSSLFFFSPSVLIFLNPHKFI